jgi:hypothetical protein
MDSKRACSVRRPVKQAIGIPPPSPFPARLPEDPRRPLPKRLNPHLPRPQRRGGGGARLEHRGAPPRCHPARGGGQRRGAAACARPCACWRDAHHVRADCGAKGRGTWGAGGAAHGAPHPMHGAQLGGCPPGPCVSSLQQCWHRTPPTVRQARPGWHRARLARAARRRTRQVRHVGAPLWRTLRRAPPPRRPCHRPGTRLYRATCLQHESSSFPTMHATTPPPPPPGTPLTCCSRAATTSAASPCCSRHPAAAGRARGQRGGLQMGRRARAATSSGSGSSSLERNSSSGSSRRPVPPNSRQQQLKRRDPCAS